MYGIKAAVRRLDFAPEAKDMEVIDVATGRFVFKPRPGKAVSLAALEKAITQARETSVRPNLSEIPEIP